MNHDADVRLLRAIQEVQTRFIDEAGPGAVFDNLLVHLLSLTDSEYGFIGEVLDRETPNPYLKAHSITDVSWNAETRRFYETHAASGMVFRNLDTLFGSVIVSRAPVISNAPAADPRRGGLPPGHPALNAFLGLPLFNQGEMIGMVGVANRPGGYDRELIDYLEPYLTTCGSILNAYTLARRRMRAEVALRESEYRYRRLVEDQPELVCRFKPDGRLTFANRAYAELFGLDPSAYEGVDLFTHIPPSETATLRAHLAALGKEHPVGRIEHTVVSATGEILWLEWIDRALLDDADNVVEFQSLGIDITARRRAEEERRALEAQLQQVQKLESLGVLAGGIAHDFNNLLTGIMGNASLAATKLDDDSPVRAHVLQIERSSRRAAELCQQMLAYSGRGRFVTRTIDLSTLVEEMVHMLERCISPNAKLTLNLSDEPLATDADPTQICQVVMNLITNASDAIERATGEIVVTTGTTRCDRAYLSGNWLDDDLEDGDYVFVDVRDTGVGIDADTLERVFDPFFTTKFAGQGLGMAAVLGIVRGHRGAIRIDSEPGAGTTVRVLLPISRRPVEEEKVAFHSVAPAQGSGLVLVVDDEEPVREYARNSLEQYGYDVVVAEDGCRALELFRERADEIGAVLLDLTMPHLGGDEVLRDLLRIRPDAAVILSSGYSGQEVEARFAGRGLSGFLQKPYRPADLIGAVEAALGRTDGK